MTTNFNHLKNARSGKALWVAIVIIAASCAFMLLTKPQTATAADKANWSAGNIISDSNFIDKNSMSVQDIQAFLDQKIGTCDVWGKAKATEYGSNLTRAEYAASRGWNAPPYTCLNMYHEVPKTSPTSGTPANNYSNPDSIPSGAQSAAWIIKDAANRYNISPKVLLVKIATESLGPLTSDTWPLFTQYRYAMGSHCPDSGPNGSANCDTNYAGFSIQMYSAAELMRWYLDSMDQSWWSYKKPYQTNKILWNIAPSNCGSGDVYIQNKATAALYTYTPYQPNQAALNNLYGTGDGCSAYGNRNVWRVYTDWFGSTNSFDIIPELKSRYDALGGVNGALGAVTDNGYCSTDRAVCWQSFKNGAIIHNATFGAWETKGSIRERWAQTGYQTGYLGYPTGPEITLANGRTYQQFEKGRIYWKEGTGAWTIHGVTGSRYLEIGADKSYLGYPTSGEIKLSTGGLYQQFEKGRIYYKEGTGAWTIHGATGNRFLSLGGSASYLGYPTSGETQLTTGGLYQQFEKGRIYYKEGTGAWTIHGVTGSRYLEIGADKSYLGYPTSGEIKLSTGGLYQQFEKGRIYYKEGTGAWTTS